MKFTNPISQSALEKKLVSVFEDFEGFKKINFALKIKGISSPIHLNAFFKELDGLLSFDHYSIDYLPDNIKLGEKRQELLEKSFSELILEDDSLRVNFFDGDTVYLCSEKTENLTYSSRYSDNVFIIKASFLKDVPLTLLTRTDSRFSSNGFSTLYDEKFSRLFFDQNILLPEKDLFSLEKLNELSEHSSSNHYHLSSLSDVSLAITPEGKLLPFFSNITPDKILLFHLNTYRSLIDSINELPSHYEYLNNFQNLHDITGSLKENGIELDDGFEVFSDLNSLKLPCKIGHLEIFSKLAFGVKSEPIDMTKIYHYKDPSSNKFVNVAIHSYSHGLYTIIPEGSLIPSDFTVSKFALEDSDFTLSPLDKKTLGMLTFNTTREGKELDSLLNGYHDRVLTAFVNIEAESDDFYYISIPSVYKREESLPAFAEYIHQVSRPLWIDIFSSSKGTNLQEIKKLRKEHELNGSPLSFFEVRMAPFFNAFNNIGLLPVKKDFVLNLHSSGKSYDFVNNQASEHVLDNPFISSTFNYLISTDYFKLKIEMNGTIESFKSVNFLSALTFSMLFYLRSNGDNFAIYFNELCKKVLHFLHSQDYRYRDSVSDAVPSHMLLKQYLLGYLYKAAVLYDSKN